MPKAKIWKLLSGLTVAGILALSLAGCGAPPQNGQSTAPSGGRVSLLETGSTLLYPLFNLWVADYTAKHPNVQITTNATGSGTGISEAENGSAQIGASDAYMDPTSLAKNPGMLNIPLAISAQQINYNVPGLNNIHLKLNGPALAKMYSTTTYWDDPLIAKLNPGVKLPHKVVVPIHRADGSGDTFIFTQYLSDSTPSTWTAGFGLSINWPPVPTGIAAEGNPGMVQNCQNTPYSVAYIGISWLDQCQQKGLGEAELQNRDGNFLLPTPATIRAAAQAMYQKTPPDECVSLVYAPGAQSYPIINYEYAIVNQKQHDAATAAAIKDFLTWALDKSGGASAHYLGQVHFQPLPSSIVQLSQSQIDKIGS